MLRGGPLLLLLILSSHCVASYYQPQYLSKAGLLSLQILGTAGDAALRAQIADLSLQLERLHKTVVMLIPPEEEEERKKVEFCSQDDAECLAITASTELENETIEQSSDQVASSIVSEQSKKEEQLRLQAEERERLVKLEEDRRREEKLKEEARLEAARLAEEKRVAEEVRRKEEERLKEERQSKAAAEAYENAQKILLKVREDKERAKVEAVAWRNLQSFSSRLKRNRKAAQLLEQSNAKEQAVSQASIDIETQLSLVKDELLAHIAGVIEENKVLREELESFKQVVVSKEEYAELLADIELMKQDIVSLKEATDKIDANVVQGIVTDALVLYDADKVGMPDYALESAGAVVFTIGETEPYTQDTPWMGVFGIPIWRSCKTPRLAIQIDNSPGNCWSFAGNKGTLTIQLAAQVFPEYFTLDHIPDALAPHGNASSAPSHFRVLGLDYGNAPKGHVLGNYEFTKLPLQTFAVQQNPYEKYFRFIKVEILSNRGNKDYTCLYRFRVHGVPHDTETFNG